MSTHHVGLKGIFKQLADTLTVVISKQSEKSFLLESAHLEHRKISLSGRNDSDVSCKYRNQFR